MIDVKNVILNIIINISTILKFLLQLILKVFNVLSCIRARESLMMLCQNRKKERISGRLESKAGLILALQRHPLISFLKDYIFQNLIFTVPPTHQWKIHRVPSIKPLLLYCVNLLFSSL